MSNRRNAMHGKVGMTEHRLETYTLHTFFMSPISYAAWLFLKRLLLQRSKFYVFLISSVTNNFLFHKCSHYEYSKALFQCNKKAYWGDLSQAHNKSNWFCSLHITKYETSHIIKLSTFLEF